MVLKEGTCLGGCGFFGTEANGGYCSACVKKGLGPSTPRPHDAGPVKCRAQCGFFASNEEVQLGFCSKCYSTFKDDFFATAVVGAFFDKLVPITQYLSVGGVTSRRISADEVKVLKQLNVFVKEGHRLVDVAAERNSNGVLGPLLAKEDEERSQSQGADFTQGSQSLSTIVRTKSTKTPPAQIKTAKDGDDAPPNNDAEASSPGTEDLIENVRLEILSTEETRSSDHLINMWTAHPLHTVVTRRAGASGAGSLPAEGNNSANRKRGREDSIPEILADVEQPIVVGKSFALPKQVQDLDWRMRQKVIGRYMEQQSMVDDISKATEFIPLVPGCNELVAVYTVADLNCLLHGAFTCMAGVRDGVLASDDPNASKVGTRTMLRDSIYQNFLQCDALKALVTQGSEKRIAEILKDSSQSRASLEGGHAFALANVLRRPIIIYAHKGLEGSFRANLKVPFRISGIYLPLLWEPTNANIVKDPIVLCYSQGHFSSLVPFIEGCGGPADSDCPYETVTIPLCDEELKPLPIPFSNATRTYQPGSPTYGDKPPMKHCEHEIDVLRRYMRGISVVTMGDGESADDHYVTTCQQWHLPIRGGPAADQIRPQGSEDHPLVTNWARYIRSMWSSFDEQIEELGHQ